MKQEKRRFSRFPFKVKAEVRIENIEYYAAEINNLSIGGCLLSLAGKQKPGTKCSVKILLSGTSSEVSIRVEGTVVRCDRGAFAIKFDRIDPDSLFHLQNIPKVQLSQYLLHEPKAFALIYQGSCKLLFFHQDTLSLFLIHQAFAQEFQRSDFLLVPLF